MTTETYDMLENEVQRQLCNLNNIDVKTKEGCVAVENTNRMLELLIQSDKDYSDSFDKQERRKIEEKKNADMIEVERSKQKITWGRAALEIGKVVAPLAISLIGYDIFQKRVIKFEETGRLVSSAWRELHLPKFMK